MTGVLAGRLPGARFAEVMLDVARQVGVRSGGLAGVGAGAVAGAAAAGGDRTGAGGRRAGGGAGRGSLVSRTNGPSIPSRMAT